MKYIKVKGQKAVALAKPYFTVGSGSGYDVSIPSTDNRIAFSIVQEGSDYVLVPGDEKVIVNSKTVSRSHRLEALDRIEWKQNTAIFVDDIEDDTASAAKTNPLPILTVAT
jgi:hypothetical protein